MTDATFAGSQSDEWFYTAAGKRVGPISGANLRELLDSQKVDADTPVWRKGQSDWKPLRDTEFGALVREAPPPVAAAHISNALVWILAVAPLAYALITATLQAAADDSGSEGLARFAAASIFFPILVNAALCLLDIRQLRRAGYSDTFLTVWALLLAPVYLFVRAKRLKQTPSYAFTWIVTFVISILIA